MDVQKCRVDLSSFGYTWSEVQYSWTGVSAVSIDELAINDYTLMGHSQGSTNITTKLGLRSVLTLQFDLSRTLGFYFLRTYCPLMIIVTSSWVSFWLVKTPAGGEIVARVGLGITCCLAVVTVGFIGDNKDKPRVSYATAMDVYIIICFAFVFMALVEFAFIHFIEMFVRRIKFKVK